jgi:tetratricopeptide (TPR) repeat protein
MEEFEQQNENSSDELNQAIQRFEDMLNRNKRYYFDQSVLSEIIDFYIEKDDLVKAAEAANMGVELFPFSIESWLKKAMVLMESDKYDAALKILDKAEAMAPGDTNIMLMRSDVLLMNDEFEKAVAVLQQGLQHADKDEKDLFYLEIADVYFEWDELEKAFDNIVLSLQNNPANEYALNRIWYLTEVTGRYEESLQVHTKIIDELPFNYTAWTNLSQAYSGLDLYEKALESCEYAIAINENLDMAYRDAGEICISMKQYKTALEYFNKVQTLAVPDAFVLYHMGFCYEKLKDFNNARSYYQRSIQVNRNFSDGYFQIAETYAKEGEWKKSIPYYRTASKMNENYLPYRGKLAKALLKSDYLREAGKAYAELIEHNPKKKTWWLGLINSYLNLGKTEDAFFAYNQAISYLGNTIEFEYLSVVIFWMNGQQSAALLALEGALTTNKKKYKLMFEFYPDLIHEPKIKKILVNYLKK